MHPSQLGLVGHQPEAQVDAGRVGLTVGRQQEPAERPPVRRRVGRRGQHEGRPPGAEVLRHHRADVVPRQLGVDARPVELDQVGRDPQLRAARPRPPHLGRQHQQEQRRHTSHDTDARPVVQHRHQCEPDAEGRQHEGDGGHLPALAEGERPGRPSAQLRTTPRGDAASLAEHHHRRHGQHERADDQVEEPPLLARGGQVEPRGTDQGGDQGGEDPDRTGGEDVAPRHPLRRSSQRRLPLRRRWH